MTNSLGDALLPPWRILPKITIASGQCQGRSSWASKKRWLLLNHTDQDRDKGQMMDKTRPTLGNVPLPAPKERELEPDLG
jgi:hypothetical protein